MCDEKVQYRSKRVALDVARKNRKKTGEAIFPYRCDRHDCWHLGHNRNAKRLADMGRGARGGLRQTPPSKAVNA